jgi:hypothetical protein
MPCPLPSADTDRKATIRPEPRRPRRWPSGPGPRPRPRNDAAAHRARPRPVVPLDLRTRLHPPAPGGSPPAPSSATSAVSCAPGTGGRSRSASSTPRCCGRATSSDLFAGRARDARRVPHRDPRRPPPRPRRTRPAPAAAAPHSRARPRARLGPGTAAGAAPPRRARRAQPVWVWLLTVVVAHRLDLAGIRGPAEARPPRWAARHFSHVDRRTRTDGHRTCGSRRVRSSGASSVTAIVCSEWAVRDPSADRIVQPSGS